MQLLNTLYITTPESYLRLDNDTLRVEVDREVRLRVPLHHIGSVVCLGNVGVSTPLVHRLAFGGIRRKFLGVRVVDHWRQHQACCGCENQVTNAEGCERPHGSLRLL